MTVSQLYVKVGRFNRRLLAAHRVGMAIEARPSKWNLPLVDITLEHFTLLHLPTHHSLHRDHVVCEEMRLLVC